MKIKSETLKKIQAMEKKMKRRESYMRNKAKEKGVTDYKGANYIRTYNYKSEDIKNGKMTEKQAERYYNKIKDDYNNKVGLYDFERGVTKEYSAKAKVAEEVEDIINKSVAEQQERIEELNKDFLDFADMVANGKTITKTLDGSELLNNLKGGVVSESGEELEVKEIGEALKDMAAGLKMKPNAASSVSGMLNILNKNTTQQREGAIDRLFDGDIELDNFNSTKQMKTYKENIKTAIRKKMREMNEEIRLGIASGSTYGLYEEYEEQLQWLDDIDDEKFATLYYLGLIPLNVREGYDGLPTGVITNRRKTSESVYSQFKEYRDFKGRDNLIVDSSKKIEAAKRKIKKVK